MRPPKPFSRIISALNSEGEFSPKALVTPHVVEFGDKEWGIEALKPYWYSLRNAATGVRFQKSSYHIPPQEEYRKAQDLFVYTLRSLVEKWLECDRNALKWCCQNPKMHGQINKLLRWERLLFVPSKEGESLLVWAKRFPAKADKPRLRAQNEALRTFVELLESRQNDRLRRCLRCGHYFFGRPMQKCCPRPRRCGSTLAAIQASKERWRQERQEALQRMAKAVAEWEQLKRRGDWKFWVAARAGVSTKKITRAFNRGEIKPPKEFR